LWPDLWALGTRRRRSPHTRPGHSLERPHDFDEKRAAILVPPVEKEVSRYLVKRITERCRFKLIPFDGLAVGVGVGGGRAHIPSPFTNSASASAAVTASASAKSAGAVASRVLILTILPPRSLALATATIPEH